MWSRPERKEYFSLSVEDEQKKKPSETKKIYFFNRKKSAEKRRSPPRAAHGIPLRYARRGSAVNLSRADYRKWYLRGSSERIAIQNIAILSQNCENPLDRNFHDINQAETETLTKQANETMIYHSEKDTHKARAGIPSAKARTQARQAHQARRWVIESLTNCLLSSVSNILVK